MYDTCRYDFTIKIGLLIATKKRLQLRTEGLFTVSWWYLSACRWPSKPKPTVSIERLCRHEFGIVDVFQ